MPNGNRLVPNLGIALREFDIGREQALQAQQRNVLAQAGQLAGQGDFAGAAQAAFQGGNIAAGTQFANLGLQEQQREIDTIARLAAGATTPELKAQAAQTVAQRFGEQKGREFLNTPNQILINDARSANEIIAQRFREQQAAQQQQAQREAGKFTTPAETTRQKEEIKARTKETAELRGRARGATSFKKKVQRIRDLINANRPSASRPDAPDLAAAAFGPIAGTETAQTALAATGIQPETVRLQQQLRALLADLELDVARFKLKGQGQVTEAERKIARDTLPSLTVRDPETALRILDGLEGEADATIQSAQTPGEAATPLADTPMQTTPGGIQFRIVQ